MTALNGGAAFARPASVQIPFSAFGYRDAVQENGPNATLTIFLPVSPNLRTIHVHVPLTISPQVDPRSSIDITANNVPIRSFSVASAGRMPTVDVDLPLPAKPARSLTIGIVGHLFVNGDICSDPRITDLWFTIRPGALLALTTGAGSSRDQVADFLAGYEGTYSIVTRGSSDDIRNAALQLAYRMHQVQRWRRIEVNPSTTASGPNTIVVGSFPNDLAVRNGELDVTPAGVATLDRRIDGMLITRSLSGLTYTPDATLRKQISLPDLGITSQTQRGTGELPFDIPLTYGAFGGVPKHLRLHVDVTHTPIHSNDRAFIQVLVNNTLIGSYDMHGIDEERFDVPLDVEALSSASVVRVVPTFFYQRDGCHGNFPSFTTSLTDNTNFQWDGIGSGTLSVGDFTRSMSGKVVVLIDDPRNDSGAFTLLSALGTVNAAVRSIDVKKFDGSIPAGYDYAVVVAAGDKIDALSPPLRVDTHDFTIYAEDGKTVRYRADYSDPFGVLETARVNGTPTLIATYWKDNAALRGIANLSPDEIAAQTDSILVFNQNSATYTDTQRKQAPKGDVIALSMPLLIGLFALLTIGVVIVASRRRV